jgi:hypothetical protein
MPELEHFVLACEFGLERDLCVIACYGLRRMETWKLESGGGG